jgi:hypothetical protein
VRAGLAGGEEGAIPGLELALTVRRAQRGPADEGDQPLLLAVFVVVRADALTGRELVHRQAELLATHERADPDVAQLVSGRVLLVGLRLDLEEIDDGHCSPSQYSAGSPSRPR